MNYSKIHRRFRYHLPNDNVFVAPEDFLGPNYETVLNFWCYLESLSREDFNHKNLITIPGYTTYLRNEARKIAPHQADAWAATSEALNIGMDYGWSTLELIVMHKILGEGKSLHIIPKILEL